MKRTGTPGTGGENSPAWAVRLAEKHGAGQLFAVAAHGGGAWVSMHERDGSGAWRMILSVRGQIGRNGLGKTREGDGKTPTGVFSFNRAFGTAEDPGCAIPYVRADGNTCWSCDGREGMHYNELVSLADCPGLNPGEYERIIDCDPQYRYCLNISYNAGGTPGLGSAIFLHCTGGKPYTAGCVAIPEDRMRFVMRRVSPACVVVIDFLENLDGNG